MLPDILEHYDPEDQFNLDETALLFRAVPSGTLAYNGSDPIGGKTAKERLTLAFITNASGSDSGCSSSENRLACGAVQV